MFPEMSEFLFSILVSYMGAVEFMFVMRHLYHWIFQHQKRLLFGDKNEESMEDLQNRIKKAIDEAAKMEKPGFTAMKDGVLYKDGFRVDPNLEQEKVAKREIIGSSKDELMCSPEEVHEEPCVKKEIKCVTESSPNNEVQPDDIIKNERTNLTQTIKTQIGQTNPQISLGQSEDSSSVEPVSSQKTSSLSNQQSSSIDTTYSMPEIHFDEYERQAPDGEDVPDQQYSEEYLRSLDGIKHRPLVREDGTGRRRAFKKRKSSDSTSSRESRASREEELKMFTSLEEEEFASMKRGDPDYVPIRYSSEPNLKVGKHHKRHKKSPMKDTSNEESKSSLEMLDEEDNNPWGEIKPEHYKNSEFWIREKAISIEEEDDDDNLNASQKKDLKGRQRLQAASPFRNIPNSSSFEDATDLQHEEAINTLKKQSSYEVEAKDNPNSENVGENKNVSREDDITQSLAENINASHSHYTSGENFSQKLTAWEASNDLSQLDSNAKLYETSYKTLDNATKIDEDQDLMESEADEGVKNEDEESDNTLTDQEILKEEVEEQKESGYYERERPSLRHNKKDFNLSLQLDSDDDDLKFSNLISESYTSSSQEIESEDNFNENSFKRVIPTIEIESDHLIQVQSDPLIYSGEETGYESYSLMEGISDFYDFNASINPSRSRSPSADRISVKSRTPHQTRESSEISTVTTTLKAEEREGISDFYDFNVHLNRAAYSTPIQRERSAHRSSVDYIIEKLGNKHQESPTGASIDLHRPSDASVTSLNLVTNLRNKQLGLESPSSPDCRRSFSTEQKDIEHIRQMQINARSHYGAFDEKINESEDRHYIRSRSQSRSLMDNESDDVQMSRKQLQDKILAEITQTTINYQEFSHDNERRGSDSALMTKPEILIQFQDEQRFDEFDDEELEAEEYHHFRRFSLNQEYQIEEYPQDDCVYIEQIEVQTRNGTRSWIREDFYDPNDRERLLTPSHDMMENSDMDTGSEDERQTIVEVNDEDEMLDLSEEEVKQFKTYENGNLNEGDWKEEGAVGGSYRETYTARHRNSSFEIEEILDEAVKNTEDLEIQRDFETICKDVTEKSNESDDMLELKTEDLLEEILSEKPVKYKTQSNSLVEPKTNSTRLRTRYGIGTSSLSYTSYETAENSNSEPVYTPKKEYNWRKNFKLDDDDDDSSLKPPSKTTKKLSFQVDEIQLTEEQEESHQEFLDSRKFSLGGESVTLYSRSPDRFQDFASDDDTQNSKEPTIKIEEPEPTVIAKKKTKKKKGRKNSKESIECDFDNTSRRSSLMVEDQGFEDDDLKKKSKKKKRKAKEVSPAKSDRKTPSKSPEPPKPKSSESDRPPLQRNDSSGVYELIKDGSMYPWF